VAEQRDKNSAARAFKGAVCSLSERRASIMHEAASIFASLIAKMLLYVYAGDMHQNSAEELFFFLLLRVKKKKSLWAAFDQALLLKRLRARNKKITFIISHLVCAA